MRLGSIIKITLLLVIVSVSSLSIIKASPQEAFAGGCLGPEDKVDDWDKPYRPGSLWDTLDPNWSYHG